MKHERTLRQEEAGTLPVFSCLLVFALSREHLFFRRTLQPRRRIASAPCRAHLCGTDSSLLLLETGVGPHAVESALSWALGSRCPDLVVSAGFSGALQPGLAVGDLVLADEVVDVHGQRWPTTWRPASSLRRGRILAAPGLIGDPVEKQRLGMEHGALAVDMETAAVASHCHRLGIPFGCLRAISDDGSTPLSPQLLLLLRDGRVAPLRLLGAMLRWPGLIGELWRLAWDTRRAARSLGQGLVSLLGVTSIGSARSE